MFLVVPFGQVVSRPEEKNAAAGSDRARRLTKRTAFAHHMARARFWGSLESTDVGELTTEARGMVETAPSAVQPRFLGDKMKKLTLLLPLVVALAGCGGSPLSFWLI